MTVTRLLIDALDRYLRQDETAKDTDNGVYRQGKEAMSAALSTPLASHAGAEPMVMLPHIGAIPASRADHPGILALERMAASIEIVGKVACWDHFAMFEIRDALCAAPGAAIAAREKGKCKTCNGTEAVTVGCESGGTDYDTEIPCPKCAASREEAPATPPAAIPAAPRDATEEQIDALDDLVTMVRRLVRALHKAAPAEPLTGLALDYLERKGFNKGPLRSAVNCEWTNCVHRVGDICCNDRAALTQPTTVQQADEAPISWNWLRGVINGLPGTTSDYRQMIARHDVLAWIDEGERRAIKTAPTAAPGDAG